MKIKNIKINQFGKIKNKEINLDNPISIIYGKNETGKSTILKFIASMFYGIAKNKNRKEISDFEKYEPWTETEFSGKIKYILDNGNEYEVYRDFNKKNPKIYNEQSEDISKEFTIDKNKGNLFFKEQTGMDEELFYHTVLAQQEEIIIDKQEQTSLLQKIANFVSAGNDNISYKKTMERLKNKLWEEVGTDRTIDRPINRIEEQLKDTKLEYQNLEQLNQKQYQFDKAEKNTKIKLEKQEKTIQMLKLIKKIKEEENLEREIIKVNQSTVSQLEKKKQEQQDIKMPEKSKKKNNAYLIIILFLITLTLVLFLFNSIIIINYIALITTIITSIIMLIIKGKQNKIKQKEKEEYIKQKKEEELLEESIAEKQQVIEKQIQELNKKMKEKEDIIKIQYKDIFIENQFQKTLEEIKEILENEEEENSELKLKWREIEIEKKNILQQIEKMAQIKEKLSSLEQEKKELNSLAISIQIARQTIEEAYEEMKNGLTPQFTESLSNIVGNITGGKYKNVKFSDEEGLLVELENGEYKKAERLSTGTIFQMYLSLRLAVAREITNERMPIILDEPFVYYDNERLENTLLYLTETYKQEQLILFTCGNREKNILEKNNIPFKLIEID